MADEAYGIRLYMRGYRQDGTLDNPNLGRPILGSTTDGWDRNQTFANEGERIAKDLAAAQRAAGFVSKRDRTYNAFDKPAGHSADLWIQSARPRGVNKSGPAGFSREINLINKKTVGQYSGATWNLVGLLVSGTSSTAEIKPVKAQALAIPDRRGEQASRTNAKGKKTTAAIIIPAGSDYKVYRKPGRHEDFVKPVLDRNIGPFKDALRKQVVASEITGIRQALGGS